MKENKIVLPLTIILLLFFLPCSVYGIYKKVTYVAPEENPDHLHFYEGSLYYYDDNVGLGVCLPIRYPSG